MARAASALVMFSCILTFFSSSSTAQNIIDSCRRSNLNWFNDRQSLADCSVGFGADAVGGRGGGIYVVTDDSDDPFDPKPGTLRYGATREEPLWIVFERDMVIKFKKDLLVNSFKTIDGRGVRVEIAYGPCITIDGVQHVIIHSISIHDCTKNSSNVKKKKKKIKHGRVQNDRDHSDGDAISVLASSNIWIDHCYFANCEDGLVDVTFASTNITISNNYFTRHKKVILLGHQDGYTADRIMQVTLVFNHFGPGLAERLPRVRYGYAHVANNFYEPWGEYAIGGSSDPTILSEGNHFIAPNDDEHKQVTKRMLEEKTGSKAWKDWKWTTMKDFFENGAYFVASGLGSGPPLYCQCQDFPVLDGSLVPSLTSQAGPLQCVAGQEC